MTDVWPTSVAAQNILEAFVVGDTPLVATFEHDDVSRWSFFGEYLCAISLRITEYQDGYKREYARYNFYANGRLLFSGNDFSPSPFYSIDSAEALAQLLEWLTLRPGDTDIEFFADYTSQQLALVNDETFKEDMNTWILILTGREMGEL